MIPKPTTALCIQMTIESVMFNGQEKVQVKMIIAKQKMVNPFKTAYLGPI